MCPHGQWRADPSLGHRTLCTCDRQAALPCLQWAWTVDLSGGLKTSRISAKNPVHPSAAQIDLEGIGGEKSTDTCQQWMAQEPLGC